MATAQNRITEKKVLQYLRCKDFADQLLGIPEPPVIPAEYPYDHRNYPKTDAFPDAFEQMQNIDLNTSCDSSNDDIFSKVVSNFESPSTNYNDDDEEEDVIIDVLADDSMDVEPIEYKIPIPTTFNADCTKKENAILVNNIKNIFSDNINFDSKNLCNLLDLVKEFIITNKNELA